MNDMAEKLALEILHGETFKAPADCAEHALSFAKEYADTNPIFAAMLTRCAETIVALLAAPASPPAALNEHAGNSGGLAGVVDQWQSIASAPLDGRTILLGLFNEAGKWRTMRGQWFSQELIDNEWEEPEDGEPGWYETSVQADDPPNCWNVDPTHWMPLPGQPAPSAGEQA